MSYPWPTKYAPPRVLNAVPAPGSPNSYEVPPGSALPLPDWTDQTTWDRAQQEAQTLLNNPNGGGQYNQGVWRTLAMARNSGDMTPLVNAIAAQYTPGGQFGNPELARVLGPATVGGAGLIASLAGPGAAAGAGLSEVALPSSVAPTGAIPGALGPSIPAVAGATAAGPAIAGGAAVAGGTFLSNNLPTILSGAASLLGGTLASNAAEDAVDAQVQAGREALDYQRESRDLALDIARPQLQSGNVALAQMLQMTGQPIPEALRASLTEAGITDIPAFDITKDPGYQFRFNQSMDALETSAFARGGGMSGGFADYALRYAQDYASTEYSNIYGRLATVAGYGPVAANSSSNTALNYGANAGNIATNTGEARASGYVAQSNAWQNALDQVAKLPWDQWFKRQQPAVAGA